MTNQYFHVRFRTATPLLILRPLVVEEMGWREKRGGEKDEERERERERERRGGGGGRGGKEGERIDGGATIFVLPDRQPRD